MVAALSSLADQSAVLAAFVLAGRSAAIADFENWVGDQNLEAAVFEMCSAVAFAAVVPIAKRIVGSLQ